MKTNMARRGSGRKRRDRRLKSRRQQIFQRLRRGKRETYLSAARGPDPTTAGEFRRRCTGEGVVDRQGPSERMAAAGIFKKAVIETDGNTGECKDRMNISYQGWWGRHLATAVDHHHRRHFTHGKMPPTGATRVYKTPISAPEVTCLRDQPDHHR